MILSFVKIKVSLRDYWRGNVWPIVFMKRFILYHYAFCAQSQRQSESVYSKESPQLTWRPEKLLTCSSFSRTKLHQSTRWDMKSSINFEIPAGNGNFSLKMVENDHHSLRNNRVSPLWYSKIIIFLGKLPRFLVKNQKNGKQSDPKHLFIIEKCRL